MEFCVFLVVVVFRVSLLSLSLVKTHHCTDFILQPLCVAFASPEQRQRVFSLTSHIRAMYKIEVEL